MNKSYEKLMEIKNSCRFDYFVMAINHYLDIGHRNALKITEKEIKAVKGNDIMSKDFCEWLLETAKKIADSVNSAIEVVQFCEAEDIFDTRYYANKLSRGDLEEMVQSRIRYDLETMNIGNPDMPVLYDCDRENFELLGWELKEEEE